MSIRDTFDHFAPPERGRFGDREADERGTPRGRVTGASDLVDLVMVHHLDKERPSAVLVSFGDRTAAKWLPKSLIEMLTLGEPSRKNRGLIDQPVRVTLPRWKAEQAGLA